MFERIRETEKLLYEFPTTSGQINIGVILGRHEPNLITVVAKEGDRTSEVDYTIEELKALGGGDFFSGAHRLNEALRALPSGNFFTAGSPRILGEEISHAMLQSELA